MTGGLYAIAVLDDSAGDGGGGPGADVLRWRFANDTKLYRDASVPWPENANSVGVDAFAGATRCGVASVRGTGDADRGQPTRRRRARQRRRVRPHVAVTRLT